MMYVTFRVNHAIVSLEPFGEIFAIVPVDSEQFSILLGDYTLVTMN
jgi:hypothetical protein